MSYNALLLFPVLMFLLGGCVGYIIGAMRTWATFERQQREPRHLPGCRMAHDPRVSDCQQLGS